MVLTHLKKRKGFASFSLYYNVFMPLKHHDLFWLKCRNQHSTFKAVPNSETWQIEVGQQDITNFGLREIKQFLVSNEKKKNYGRLNNFSSLMKRKELWLLVRSRMAPVCYCRGRYGSSAHLRPISPVHRLRWSSKQLSPDTRPNGREMSRPGVIKRAVKNPCWETKCSAVCSPVV